jgi:hypothetical protein
MGRTPREDHAGAWHHVMNRGIARRTIFERRSDVRLFLAGLARMVRAGLIEVHAYCVLTTHYHLLLRSPVGRLAEAMHGIQLAYSRAFNRSRRRDGPLVRGRYRSKPVQSVRYRKALVAYIDGNPVDARMAKQACEYPYGSAYHYQRDRGPIWLERTWVERTVQTASDSDCYDPCDYEQAFPRARSKALQPILKARIASRCQLDPLDDLVGNAPGRVLKWMRRKAALADGTLPGMPVADPKTMSPPH